MTETTIDLDPIHNAMAGLALREEAVMRRMLCTWEPAWGEPVLVHGNATLRRWDDPAGVYRVESAIAGLGLRADVGQPVVLMVMAADHIDARGAPMAPIPDRGMLAIFEARLAKRVCLA